MTSILTSRLLAANGVPHAFSLRGGGVSIAPFDSLNLGSAVGDEPTAVEENLRRLLRAARVAPDAFVSVRQVHGDRVVHAAWGVGRVELRDTRQGAALAGPVEADAIIGQPGTVVGVRVADCVPILLHDPVTGLSAAIHAGWRGTVALIVSRTIDILSKEYAVRPASLRAVIGPFIGPCCFEVGDEVAERFASDAAFGPDTVDRTRAKPHVDLGRANRRLLEAAGVEAAHVEAAGGCTSCDPARYFSHRRDDGRTGRHLALVAAGRF